MSWTRTRIQEDSVLPGIFSQDLREESQELRTLPYGKAAGPGRPTHMHAYVCTCTSVCVRVCACSGVGGSFPGSGLARSCAPTTPAACACPGPHPSTAPLPAASPSCLLWQMFGRAMATPEQDVPLDRSRDKPTLPGLPCCFPPQRLAGKNCWGPGQRQMVFVWERGRASVLGVSGRGRGGRTFTPLAESLLVQRACVCPPLPFRAMLRKQGGKRGCPAAANLFPTIIATSLCQDLC